ncbi:MAG: hypothetical protein ABL912_01870 [Novosphingobium sp.]
MGDANLAATGKDVTVELLLDGAPQKIIDQVVRFTSKAEYQSIETRHLGSNDVDIEREPDGWSGELEISRKSGQLDDFINFYNLQRRSRIPVLIIITELVKYRDGTSRQFVYPDVKVDFSTDHARGANTTTRIPWRCGVERI